MCELVFEGKPQNYIRPSTPPQSTRCMSPNCTIAAATNSCCREDVELSGHPPVGGAVDEAAQNELGYCRHIHWLDKEALDDTHQDNRSKLLEDCRVELALLNLLSMHLGCI